MRVSWDSEGYPFVDDSTDVTRKKKQGGGGQPPDGLAILPASGLKSVIENYTVSRTKIVSIKWLSSSEVLE